MRDDVPAPVRSFVVTDVTTIGQAELSAREYIHEIDEALTEWTEDIDQCSELRDQVCLTEAV